jgi:hypothetical protein
MSRAFRYFLRASAFLSLLLCVVAAILWPISHSHPKVFWTRERPVSGSPGETYQLQPSYSGGEIEFWYTRILRTPPFPGASSSPRFDYSRIWLFAGVEVGQKKMEDDTFHETDTGMKMPFWILVLMFSIFPICLGLRHIRRRMKPPSGLCPNCNYDLRAHKAGDNCPECGTQIESSIQSRH